MRRFFIIGGMSIGGWLGWWAGYQVNIWLALVLTSIGSGLGIYAGRWFVREYLD